VQCVSTTLYGTVREVVLPPRGFFPPSDGFAPKSLSLMASIALAAPGFLARLRRSAAFSAPM